MLTGIFTQLLKSSKDAIVVKILTLLVERNQKLVHAFIKFINASKKAYSQQDLIFSIISSNLKYKWDQSILDELYKLYKHDIVNFVTEPSMGKYIWIEENVDAIEYLIDKNFGMQKAMFE